MKIKANTILIFTLFLGLLGVVFLFGYVVAQRKGDVRYNRAILGHKEEIRRYTVMLDSQDVVVAEKDQEILSQREAIKRGDIEREELRKLNIKRVNEITRLKLRIDTLLTIKPDTNIFVIDTCNGKPVLPLPYSFSKKDQFLTLNGTIDTKGTLDLGLGMDIPLDVYGAIDKDTKNYKVAITTANKYVNLLSISSQKFDVPSPKKWGIGFQIGWGVDVLRAKTSPFIGFGLNRNLIRF